MKIVNSSVNKPEDKTVKAIDNLGQTTKAAIQMPQTALNRIVGGGGTTIIKKVVSYIFED